MNKKVKKSSDSNKNLGLDVVKPWKHDHHEPLLPGLEPYKSPSDEEWDVICHYFKNKVVVDLGSGDLNNARIISDFAKRVVGIDYKYQAPVVDRFLRKNFERVDRNLWDLGEGVYAIAETVAHALQSRYLNKFKPTCALIAWPFFWDTQSVLEDARARLKGPPGERGFSALKIGDDEAIQVIENLNIIAYFGANNDNHISGDSELWSYFMHREVLESIDTHSGYDRHSTYIFGPREFEIMRKQPLVQEFSIMFGLITYEMKDIIKIHKECLLTGMFRNPSYRKIKKFIKDSGFRPDNYIRPLGKWYEEQYP
jgi:hypothetical protein